MSEILDRINALYEQQRRLEEIYGKPIREIAMCTDMWLALTARTPVEQRPIAASYLGLGIPVVVDDEVPPHRVRLVRTDGSTEDREMVLPAVWVREDDPLWRQAPPGWSVIEPPAP